jgi:hypothetical protein
MRTIHWKLKGVILGGLLLAGAGALANACGGDDNANPPIVEPDGGTTTTGAGGAGGTDMTTTTTTTTGSGGTGGTSGTGGTGGTGGAGVDGGDMCPANGAGSFDNATRLMGLLSPDGGILPL